MKKIQGYELGRIKRAELLALKVKETTSTKKSKPKKKSTLE
jgi:hypothetical protein